MTNARLPYVVAIPCLDPILHDASRPFCSDPRCPCHRDDDLIRTCLLVPQAQGLLSYGQAQAVYRGNGLDDTEVEA